MGFPSDSGKWPWVVLLADFGKGKIRTFNSTVAALAWENTITLPPALPSSSRAVDVLGWLEQKRVGADGGPSCPARARE